MSEAAAIDAGRTIDEGGWGAYQRWLVFLTALTIVFDGIDNQLLGISIPAIMSEWSSPRAAFAPVVALGFLGMMIGGAAAGLAGDRMGRRSALLGSMVLFGLATLAVAGADSVSALAVLRFVAGIGLGGALPNAATLAAEYVPLARRPLAVTLTIVCVPLGGTLAGLLAIPALPALGWRYLFAIGGVAPVLAALALARALPESPRYLARHPARRSELARLLRRMGYAIDPAAAFVESPAGSGARAPLVALFNPEFRRDTFALWVAFLSCLLAVYLGFTWLPSILTGAGLGAAVANTGIMVFNLGGVAGAIAGGICITRFGSRRTMLVMAAAAVAGSLALGVVPMAPGAPVLPIVALLAVTGGLINAVQTTLYALAAHVYPTLMRATGVGAAVAIGRSGAIFSGYAGPWALELGGGAAFFGLMAAAVLSSFLALAVVGRHVPRSGARRRAA